MSAYDLIVTNEIGTELLKQAIESRKKKVADQCVGEVETVINLIDITKARIKDQENRLKVYQARLAAIESGAVIMEISTMNRDGTPGQRIVYNDENLRPEKVGF